MGLDVIGAETTDTATTTSTWGYHHHDGLGSLRAVTDGAGTTTYAASYDPYGAPLPDFGATTTSFGYTGEQTDAHGAQYLRARYYDPSIGIFLGRDPVMGMMGLAMSMNGYSYVHGNPVNFTDPSGEFVVAAIVVGALIGAAIGGGIAAHNQYQQHGTDFDCWDKWSIGKSMLAGAAIGAVSGGVGAGVAALGAGMAASAGITATSALSTKIAAGVGITAVSSVASGQAARATGNVLGGNPISQGLFNPRDMLTDAAIGVAAAAAIFAGTGILGGGGAAYGLTGFATIAVPGAGMAAAMSADDAARYGQYWDNAGRKSFVHQMPTRDAVAYNQYWNRLQNETDVNARLAAEAERELANAITGRRRPVMITGLADRRTGKTYTAQSGHPRPIGDDIHPDLRARMPAESAEYWPINNCSEFQACNQALWDGAKYDDLSMYTIRRKTGEPEPRCYNCIQTSDGVRTLTDFLHRP